MRASAGTQTQDGVVDVVDIVSINLAIFGAVQVSPLCDTNFDGKCVTRRRGPPRSLGFTPEVLRTGEVYPSDRRERTSRPAFGD